MCNLKYPVDDHDKESCANCFYMFDFMRAIKTSVN